MIKLLTDQLNELLVCVHLGWGGGGVLDSVSGCWFNVVGNKWTIHHNVPSSFITGARWDDYISATSGTGKLENVMESKLMQSKIIVCVKAVIRDSERDRVVLLVIIGLFR